MWVARSSSVRPRLGRPVLPFHGQCGRFLPRMLWPEGHDGCPAAAKGRERAEVREGPKFKSGSHIHSFVGGTEEASKT